MSGIDAKINIKNNEWIVPCNTKYFDVKKAFKELKIIDWRQTFQMKKARVGDLVYLYCKSSSGKGRIAYKGAILEINKTDNIIDDSRFSADHSISSGPCFSLAVFRVYELGDALSYPKLKDAGLKSKLQGPIRVKGELADYLHSCDSKQRKIDKGVNSLSEECLAEFPIDIVEDNQFQESSSAIDSFDELCNDVSNGIRTAWLFTPGEKGCMMNRFVDGGIAALDWWRCDFGDLSEYGASLAPARR